MNNFKKLNLTIGWLTFVLSTLVYTLTMEPSASLWDCSEFITTSYKMEIGHPPGAPLFMMINRLFTMFAPDVSFVAPLVNFAAVIASSLTVMFLYWTIAHLALKLLDKDRETADAKQSILVYGSAFVGAMSYAFIDTTWFSAVEGEVYAQSSLFTAMVVWAMFKWENEFDKPYGTRWLILIAYLMGLSIGVHLLNLLAIPALVMIFYYKRNTETTRLGWWKAFGLSVIILAAVLFVAIPKTIAVGAWMDKFFVNTLGFEKNIGLLSFVVGLFALLVGGIYYTHKHQRLILNTVLLCFTVMMMGYGTYASVIIRSSVNTPLNSNQPDNAYSLLSFLNRDQYGKTPLFFGPYFSSPQITYEAEEKLFYYDKAEKKYNYYSMPNEKTIVYADGSTTIFPRMFNPLYADQYKNWVNITGKKIRHDGKMVVVPTFAENLEYFFKYQVNYMYWRYFLWNFVGRQNDLQGDGGVMSGNWLSGIKFIDEIYLGPQDNLPDDMLNNAARNTYFFLPFLLGIAGLVYQMGKRKGDFVIVSLLFLMTGLAIILYLNQTPGQPRERDYAYAGSFYAFCIWIGLGVFWVQSMVSKVVKSRNISSLISVVVAMIVPTLLLAQNWDDHDRSNRYVAQDLGANYLESTLPNSIYVPYGDNDTFGPWFAQEVLDVRPDVRVCNMSYLQSGWYASQMKYKFNDSDPIKFTIPERVYGSDLSTFLPIFPVQDGYVKLNDALNFIEMQSPAKAQLYKQVGLDRVGAELFPANKIAIPVNKENALKAGIIKEKDLHRVVDTIYIDLVGSSISREKYLILDMIASSDWSRPIYFSQDHYGVKDLGLEEYLQQDGMAFRLVPIKTPKKLLKSATLDSEYLYDNLMNKFKFGNLKDPRVHLDIFNRNYVRSSQLRGTMSRLAVQLVDEGKPEKANDIILKCLEEIPLSQIGYDYMTPMLIEALHVTGNREKAEEIMAGGVEYYMQYIEYYSQFSESQQGAISEDLGSTLQNMLLLYQVANAYDFVEATAELKPFADMYYN